MIKRLMPIDPIKDATTRYQMNQTPTTFLVNLLKDYIRSDFNFYDDFVDKDVFCMELLGIAVKDLQIAGANSPLVWDSVDTYFGATRKLSKFGNYLTNIIGLHQHLSDLDLQYIIRLARQKVD